jgi:hypothetical protein
MKQGAFWEANSRSASQEIPRLLCNREVYYRVHKTPPIFPILIPMYPIHT